jgi:hypothetical protein
VIVVQLLVRDDLQRIQAGTIVYMHEREAAFGRAPGTHPAFHGEGGADIDLMLQYGSYGVFAHSHRNGGTKAK